MIIKVKLLLGLKNNYQMLKICFIIAIIQMIILKKIWLFFNKKDFTKKILVLINLFKLLNLILLI